MRGQSPDFWLLGAGRAPRIQDGYVAGMTSQVFYFESLPQMVATSDLVVEGAVQTVESGRVLGDGEAAIQFAQVTLAVSRVLFGRLDANTVLVEEFGLEGHHPSRVADHGVYFLHQKTDAPEFYRLVNRQGRFLDDGKGRLVALDHRASWARAIESQTLAQLATGVEDGARAVAKGEVVPAKHRFPRG